MGLVIGIAYGLLHVRSPAPPLIGLVGLLGMVRGEQLVNAVRPQVVTAAHTSARQPPDHAGAARWAGCGTKVMVAVTFQEKSKMPRRTGVGLLALSLVLTAPFVALASSDEPAGINLGHQLHGRIRQDWPGFVYQQYFQIERYDAINDQNGHNLPTFQGVDINAATSLNQFIYVSPYHLLGGALGVDALLPIVDLSAAFAPTSPEKLTAYRGLRSAILLGGHSCRCRPWRSAEAWCSLSGLSLTWSPRAVRATTLII
jgi:XapX domain-containing protein